MYTGTSIQVHIYRYTYTGIFIQLYLYRYIYIDIHIYLHLYSYIYISTHIKVCRATYYKVLHSKVLMVKHSVQCTVNRYTVHCTVYSVHTIYGTSLYAP